jgi:hypothetical protein
MVRAIQSGHRISPPLVTLPGKRISQSQRKAICLYARVCVCIFLICPVHSAIFSMAASPSALSGGNDGSGILMSDLSTSVAHFISRAPDQEQVCCNDYWPLLHCRHLFSIQTEFTPKGREKCPFHASSASRKWS